MKAVLLCRVSSKEQEDSGYSLPAQEKILVNYAKAKELVVAKTFTISESAGGKKQRDTFNSMFNYVKKHSIKAIVIEKADRFTRNFKDSVEMYKWLDEDEERQLHSVKDSLILHKNSRSQEKLNWDIRVVFAKNYIDNLSEEVKKGQKEKLAQGWLPTRPPVGYRTIGETGHKTHVIDPQMAPLVKKIFELYDTGQHSVKTIAVVAEEIGLKSTMGNPFPKSRIHKILQEPFYIGKMVWKGQIYQGKQEPIIDEELYERVQWRLKSRTTPRRRVHFYTYKSIIKCDECDGTITWEQQKGIVYGHCNHYHQCSQKTWSKEKEVSDQLTSSFEALEVNNHTLMELVKDILRESQKDKNQTYLATLDSLNEELQKLEKRLDRLYEDKLDEKISQDFYNRKFKDYSTEKDRVTSLISKHSKSSTQQHELSVLVYELSQRAQRLFKYGKAEKKRQLIELVFENLRLNEGKLLFDYAEPFKSLAEAVKQTNSSKELEKAISNIQTFEPEKFTDLSDKMSHFLTLRPIVLPR